MTAADFYAQLGPNAPAYGSATVTPSDTENFADAGGNPRIARGLEVLAAGTLTFVGADGVTDSRVVAAAWVPYLLPVAVLRVKATGTTGFAAGDIKALW